MNKKGGKDAVSKRRTRKSTKTVQKAIVGLSLEDIKRTRAQKPDASKVINIATSRKKEAQTQMPLYMDAYPVYVYRHRIDGVYTP